MREIQIGRVYRHFKGDYYLVEAVARDSETEQPVVIYRKLYADGGLWIRPLSMFLSRVDRKSTRTCSRSTGSSCRRLQASPGTDAGIFSEGLEKRRLL